ncbi:hypothetical protein QBC42DRAFT_344555 [Cladorrhinum samala]|uniref:SET domain-containing protein n=1 Tax=Cladorrhinum samala TaxID=585594 RepID=A0AAV9HUT7_9PEZI|nr:hypothetical protein QBC42DRAFT_344555 [Cladorrhinum samala]
MSAKICLLQPRTMVIFNDGLEFNQYLADDTYLFLDPQLQLDIASTALPILNQSVASVNSSFAPVPDVEAPISTQNDDDPFRPPHDPHADAKTPVAPPPVPGPKSGRARKTNRRNRDRVPNPRYTCSQCGERCFEARALHRHLWGSHREFAEQNGVPSEMATCPVEGCGHQGRKDNVMLRGHGFLWLIDLTFIVISPNTPHPQLGTHRTKGFNKLPPAFKMPKRKSGKFQMDQTSRGRFYRVNKLTRAEIPIPNVKKLDNYYFDHAHWNGVPEQDMFSSSKSVGVRFEIKKKILRLEAADDPTGVYPCLQCGHGVAWPRCNITCYKTFRRLRFRPGEDKIEIQAADPADPAMGDGVFVKPGQSIAAGEVLGEYIGELHPVDGERTYYSFVVESAGLPNSDCLPFTIDSRDRGNWTRFVNHRCDPNVSVDEATIGKLRVLVLRARRDLGAGEQLFIHYGLGYFNNRAPPMLCRCDLFGGGPHAPVDPDAPDGASSSSDSSDGPSDGSDGSDGSGGAGGSGDSGDGVDPRDRVEVPASPDNTGGQGATQTQDPDDDDDDEVVSESGGEEGNESGPDGDNDDENGDGENNDEDGGVVEDDEDGGGIEDGDDEEDGGGIEDGDDEEDGGSEEGSDGGGDVEN